jgi:hypothetical protein
MDERANFDEILLWHDPATGAYGSWVKHCTVVEHDVMTQAGSSKLDRRARARMVLADGTVISGHIWVIATAGDPPPPGAQEVDQHIYEQIVAESQAHKQADLERLSTVRP